MTGIVASRYLIFFSKITATTEAEIRCRHWTAKLKTRHALFAAAPIFVLLSGGVVLFVRDGDSAVRKKPGPACRIARRLHTAPRPRGNQIRGAALSDADSGVAGAERKRARRRFATHGHAG